MEKKHCCTKLFCPSISQFADVFIQSEFFFLDRVIKEQVEVRNHSQECFQVVNIEVFEARTFWLSFPPVLILYLMYVSNVCM